MADEAIDVAGGNVSSHHRGPSTLTLLRLSASAR